MSGLTTALVELPQASDNNIRPLVEAELNRITQHSLFKDTTRMKRFLKYVVTEALEGRESRLKGYVIGLEVFDRADDFDPQADTIVRVQAGQLRRRLDLYYSGDGKEAPVRILIPKGRYVPIFEIRRDVTKENIEKIGTISKIEAQNRPGIAVLSFQNLAQDRQHDYFAEGITAEMINALVQFRYLRIVARTASVTSNATPTELSEIAEQYGVQFVLSGNVRRAGNLVRISVNLLSTETSEHVYSKIFDRECTPENIFDVQEEVASYIAANVAAPFGAVNRYNRRLNSGRKSSLTAYEAFLKYYDMNLSPSGTKAKELLAEFEEITEKTPRFSSAWAIRAILNVFLVTQCLPPSDPNIRLAAAIKQGTRASAIDPENSLAFNALFQAHFHSGNIDMAEKMAAKAIMLNPNDYNMLAYYSLVHAFLGDHIRAIAFQNSATELIGRPPAWFFLSSLICSFQNGDFESVFEVIKDVDSDTSSAVQMLALACAGHLGRKGYCEAFKKRVLSEDSNFSLSVSESFEFWQPNDTLRQLCMKGWQKAGLEIPA